MQASNLGEPPPGNGTAIGCVFLAGSGEGPGGWSRAEAAEAYGMDRQALRDWVRQYNHDGGRGLGDAKRSDRPLAVAADRLEELTAPVLAGPDPALLGITGWRCLNGCAFGKMLQHRP